MRLNLFTLACTGLIFLFTAANSAAQQTPAPDTLIYTVETKDGNVFFGTLVEEGGEYVVLKTENFGDVTILRKAIRSMRPLARQKMVNGKVWFDNPFSSRYFAGTSGYGLRKGEGSVDNGWVIFNQISYGFSDHFTLGIGLAPLLVFDGPFPLWITPKFSFPLKKDRLNLAVGGMYGRAYSDYEFDDSRFGAVYSQLTVGSRDANLSVGIGYGFSDGSWSQRPLFSINGLLRTSPRFALILESYIVTSDYEFDSFGLAGTGVRFMGRRFALDVAMLSAIFPDDGVYPLPWVGMHVPFGISKAQ